MELPHWNKWWKQTGEAELSTLLMIMWDPIQVANAPEAWGEYDTYLPQIVSLLREGAPTNEVAQRLADLASRIMESDYSGQAYETLAVRLVEWHAGSTSRFARQRGWDLW